MVSTRVDTALRKVSLFRDLSDNELHVLTGQAILRHFSRHEVIFSQGDPGDGLYLVLDGHVGITRQNPDGDELLLSVHEHEEYFGELALFDRQPRSATATAVDECTLLFLPKVGFRALLDQHPQAVYTCLEVIVGRLRKLTDLADEIALLDIRTRLARRLLRLATEGVVEMGEGHSPSSPGDYRITQQELASMLGATRESVNKHLSSFVDAGVIRLDRGHICILDHARLKAASQELF